MRLLALALLIVAACAKHEEYKGWKSYILEPSTQEELVAVRGLQSTLDLDFLSPPSLAREGVALVKPRHVDSLNRVLEEIGVKYHIHSEDVKASLDIDDILMEAKRNITARTGGRQMPYDNYQQLDVIEAYIDDIARRYPHLVTLVEPARSFEGRPLKYLKISTTSFQDRSKPVIIIDGGIHAREWIAPPSVTWAIHKLVEDVTEPDLLQRFDWVILPVVNPDGYSFTHTNSRFWRKTRSTDQNSLSGICPGVDGNRNYDFAWNTVGTSNSPCADTYAGGRAFSEVETRVVRDIILEHLNRTALYLTIHSYGSMILYPWGHDGSLSSHAGPMHTVGVAMAEAIRSASIPSFPRYLVGNSVQVIGYPAAGAAEDYAHSVGIPFSYTYELPGLSGGLNGFHLAPQYIEQVCRETWAGIAAGARRAGQLYRGPIVP